MPYGSSRSVVCAPPACGALSRAAGRHFSDLLRSELKAAATVVAAQRIPAPPPVARLYQRELVEKVGSRNAIVVCDTGAGKTLVSAMVIERALSGNAPSGMVVYLEKMRHMVVQQRDALRAHFHARGHADAEYVEGYMGGEFTPAWSILRRRHRILVMTVDLFLTRLTDGEASMDDCLLIVFDECHDAKNGHSYNRVNQQLKRMADDAASAHEGGRSPRLPQILGLTATPSWKDTPAQNLAALATLSSNMNGAEIVQVTEETESLREHVHEPTERMHPLQLRDVDEEYKRELPEVMQDLEETLASPFGGKREATKAVMRKLAAALSKDRLASQVCHSKKYEQQLKAHLPADVEPMCCIAKVALRILASLNSAFAITDEVGFESAQCLLGSALFECVEMAMADDDDREECLEVVRSVLESELCQDRFVRPLLDAHPLSARATVHNCSPKLAALVELLTPFEAGRPLRGIIFVQTRTSAHRVVNFIQAHPHLHGFVRPAVFCGHAEMSSRAQETVRQAFELGRFNLLVATSVGEEGLNIKDMNLAIMLDGVTSGRANDQCKGRVMRMRGGEFHVLYYQRSQGSHVWRAQQQSQAAKEALSELASSAQGRLPSSSQRANHAFANLAIGANPLVQLNNLKQKGCIEGPECEVSERNGQFEASASYCRRVSNGGLPAYVLRYCH